jgi:hypothetical protein
VATVETATDELLVQMTTSLGGEPRRIGVTTPEGEGDHGEFLQDEIIAAFLRAQIAGVEIYERSRLNAILEEAAFGISGLVAEETAVEFGEMVGVDALVVGAFRENGTVLVLSARLVDAETGQILGAGSVDFPASLVAGSTGTAALPTLLDREFTVRELVLRPDIQPDPANAVQRITTFDGVWTEYDRSDRMIATGTLSETAPGQFAVEWTFPDMGITYYNYHRTADSFVARVIADETEIGYIEFSE